MLTDAIANTAVWGKVWSGLFGNQITAANPKVNYMRSVWSHHGPIRDGTKRYKNIKDEKTKQAKVVTEFQKNMRDWGLSSDAKWEDIEVKVFGGLIIGVYFEELLFNDMSFAIGSLLFVFAFIWYHLASFFMAGMTMLMILFSFPITYTLYGGVFQIPFNDTLISLSIFIVLGIAADDVFVFCDAWRQSKDHASIANDEKLRMAYTFKRAFKAILVTSSTTCVAFLANGLSEVVPIRAFGIFAAIIIPVNFVLVIMIMPAIQIIHDHYFAKWFSYKKIFAACCPCCCKRPAGQIETENA